MKILRTFRLNSSRRSSSGNNNRNHDGTIRRGGLGLPKYQRNENERRWVASKRRTAKLIQSLWKAAEQKLQTDPAFLCLLVQCGWTNAGEKGSESVLRWRNQNIADYLKVPYRSDEQLAQLLSYRFKGLEPLSTSRRNTPLSNSPAPAAWQACNGACSR